MRKLPKAILIVVALLFAGCSSQGSTPAKHAAAPVAVAVAHATPIALVPDPEAAQSSPEPANAPAHAAAQAPSVAASATTVAPGAPSDAQVRQELAQMNAALKAAKGTPVTAAGGASIDAQGNASPPPGAPAAVARVIAGANAIATFPYVFGGGHASFVDTAYDCSGSVSYALAAGGMLSAPVVSGQLMSWGAPGPGRWITVEAKAGHVYMYVAGLRYDTSFRNGPFGTRWQIAHRTNIGFVARHWPGL
jgi:cell wall-associated NlpC family hydrolase